MSSSEEMEWDDPALKDYALLQRYAFISQRAIDHNYVGFCYREHSEIKIDSGWRFLYGDEDEDFLDNPDNIITQNLSDVIQWKPELESILSARHNSEFEWNPDKEVFEAI